MTRISREMGVTFTIHYENYRESAKLFVSSKILSGLGSVASQEIGELVNTWVQRPGQHRVSTSVRITHHEQYLQASSFHAASDGASPSLVLVRARSRGSGTRSLETT